MISFPETSSVLTLKPATLDDVGSCTCFASGVGTQDSEEIVISGDGNYFAPNSYHSYFYIYAFLDISALQIVDGLFIRSYFIPHVHII